MIDPYDLNQPWTKERLQEWILFGICVANKPARATAEKLDRLLADMREQSMPSHTPFACVETAIKFGRLGRYLRKHRVGQYKRINKAFREVIRLDMRTITVAALETVHGIGPKTARMIMLYYKPELQVVPLDTHVLKWLKAQGYNAPKNTPTGKRYYELERAFLAEAQKMGLTAKELDTQVWQAYAIG